MSQSRSLSIYFILPNEDAKAEPSKDMCGAFNLVKQYKGKPQWVVPSYCLTYVPSQLDVFVLEDFVGAAFEKLKDNSAKIIGAKCLLSVLTMGDSIPPGLTPIFSEAMKDIIVCFTGIDDTSKKALQEKIEYMAGVCDNVLRAVTTHVVAGNCIAAKAIQSFSHGKPVMKPDWVNAVWERCHENTVSALDAEFSKYKAPLFYNLKMTCSGIPKREKEKLGDIISHHGGTLSGVLEERSTNLLLIAKPYGDKYNAARQWKIKCIKPHWIHKCVESGKTLPLKEYILGDPTHAKVSTPEKGVVDLTANFSVISAITAQDDKNLTHMDETEHSSREVTLSQNPSAKSAATDLINNLISGMRDAGQFLDGCNIYLAGFGQEHLEKLKKVLNFGGATRFDELTRSVTHIVTNGNVLSVYKEFGAYVLTLDWLVQSMQLKKPAPVENFAIAEKDPSKNCPTSPLSKQGALLLARPEPVEDPVEVEALPAVDDLANRYNLSQQGEPLSQRQVERNTTSEARPTATSMKSELTCDGNIFQGLKIYFSREICDEDRNEVEETAAAEGAEVVSDKFKGVADLAVVPVAGAALTEITAREIVNLFFIKDCLLSKTIVPILYFHRPVAWAINKQPLQGCVLSVSLYTGSEREFVEIIIDTLGGIVQPILARKPKGDLLKTTHLICSEPTGMKYEGARRWNLPVVHHRWLLDCAEKGIRLPEERYSIGDTKTMQSPGTITEVPDSARKARAAARRVPSDSPVVEISSAKKQAPFIQRLASGASSPDAQISSARKQAHPIQRMDSDESRCIAEVASARKQPSCEKNVSVPSPEISASKQGASVNMMASDLRTPLSEAHAAGEQNKSVRNLQSKSPPATPVVDNHHSPLSNSFVARKMPLELSQTRTPNTRSSGRCSQAAGLEEFDAPSPYNKALQRVRQLATPTNLDCSNSSGGTATPTSPYGAFYGNDNPSPGTRKRLKKWAEQGAEFTPEPPPAKRKVATPPTPVSVYLDRQLKMMMSKRDLAPDESCSPAKRLQLSLSQESTKNQVMDGLQKMLQIEENYSKANAKVSVSPVKSSSEVNNLVIVAQSQPHTEVGWEDPTEKESHVIHTEELAPKVFMLSGLGDSVESAKKIIEQSGGQVSTLSCFDNNATHIIASSNMARAEKLMGSIASGLWILHPSYLEHLKTTKDVYALRDQDFEWGNPLCNFSKDNLLKTAQECVQSAYNWRVDIKVKKKSPPFHGKKIILALSDSKRDSFKRLVEAGGGEVVDKNAPGGPNVFCVCDSSTKAQEFASYVKRNITCVSLLFISDVIIRKPNAINDHIISSHAQISNKSRS